jgi:hypothetical protein
MTTYVWMWIISNQNLLLLVVSEYKQFHNSTSRPCITLFFLKKIWRWMNTGR